MRSERSGGPVIFRVAILLLIVLELPGLSQPVYAEVSKTTFTEDVLRSPGSEVETSKLGTWDTATVDPFHVELYFAYLFTASGNKFDRRGGIDDRKLYRRHDFLPYIIFGLLKNMDITFYEGYAMTCDKEITTGGADGPHHGEGMTDLQIAPRWRFYEKPAVNLSFAYVPIVTAPTGRRTSTASWAPSQAYTSLQHNLVMTKNFGRVNTNSSLAFTNVFGSSAKTKDLRGTMDFNFAIGYQIFQWFEPEFEVRYGQDLLKHRKSAGIFDMTFGLLFPIGDHLRIDVGLVQDIAGYRKDQTTGGIFQVMLAI